MQFTIWAVFDQSNAWVINYWAGKKNATHQKCSKKIRRKTLNMLLFFAREESTVSHTNELNSVYERREEKKKCQLLGLLNWGCETAFGKVGHWQKWTNTSSHYGKCTWVSAMLWSSLSSSVRFVALAGKRCLLTRIKVKSVDIFSIHYARIMWKNAFDDNIILCCWWFFFSFAYDTARLSDSINCNV